VSGVNGDVLAVSDLHVAYDENRALVADLEPNTEDDWLIVAGDVAEEFSDVQWALELLAGRFAKVSWVPGNHELWTHPRDAVTLRGEHRYRELVELCRRIGVITPEDPYPVWHGADRAVVLAPLFVLYDYSFLTPGTTNKEESLQAAYDSGIVCTDEYLLHPDPYPTREAWCRVRVDLTQRRLAAIDPARQTVLINHFPLVREPTHVLYHPEFGQWCGTTATADWHVRHRAAVVVYGHLHIPRTTFHDGVRFEEVSVGYPYEWKGQTPRALRTILSAGPESAVD
jgi:3',5'-cyclic AMP phosphodiesterase CpdA